MISNKKAAILENEDLVPEVVKVEEAEEVKVAVPEKPKKDAVTLKAEKVTDAQIKQYWRKEEEVRKAPRGISLLN